MKTNKLFFIYLFAATFSIFSNSSNLVTAQEEQNLRKDASMVLEDINKDMSANNKFSNKEIETKIDNLVKQTIAAYEILYSRIQPHSKDVLDKKYRHQQKLNSESIQINEDLFKNDKLFNAIITKNVNKVKKIVKKIDLKTENGCVSKYHLISPKSQADKILKEFGINISVSSYNYTISPLSTSILSYSTASKKQDKEACLKIIEILLKNKANPNEKIITNYFDVKQKGKNITRGHLLCDYLLTNNCSIEIFKLFLKYGLDPSFSMSDIYDNKYCLQDSAKLHSRKDILDLIDNATYKKNVLFGMLLSGMLTWDY